MLASLDEKSPSKTGSALKESAAMESILFPLRVGPTQKGGKNENTCSRVATLASPEVYQTTWAQLFKTNDVVS